MAYRLQPGESVPDGLRRCAREQLDQAIDQLSTRVTDDPVEAVHEARKSLKKARSILRLGRGALDSDQRRRDNAALRDAGRKLSAARDAEVMLEATDELAERFAGRVPQATFEAIRRHLAAERGESDAGLTGQVAEELKAVRSRIDEWPSRKTGWKALEPGLKRSYARGRAGFERARSHPTAENLHEWRKRTKDLWYHLRLLKPLAPGIVGGAAKEADKLSKLLGDDHDLAVLHATLDRGAGDLKVDVDAVLALIDHRREQLQAEAVLLGQRLYAERPKAFVARMHRYWKASRPRAAARS
ncbi:MAG TPA: CHAD domain-containing protein [Solirubrobacteraceae bacterium]|nr:CHAD domain-containing protein [Solirubrobacteraceae bacterium]